MEAEFLDSLGLSFYYFDNLAACYQKVGIVRWLCASMNARVPLVKSRPSRWATSRILAAMFCETSRAHPSSDIQRYDPHGPLILTLQEVPDDGCCVRFGWIGLDICQTGPPSRFTAGCAEFFILSQSGERPSGRESPSASTRCLPSPILQAWAKKVEPSPRFSLWHRIGSERPLRSKDAHRVQHPLRI